MQSAGDSGGFVFVRRDGKRDRILMRSNAHLSESRVIHDMIRTTRYWISYASQNS